MWRAVYTDENGDAREVRDLTRIGPIVESGKGHLWFDMHKAEMDEVLLLKEVFHLDPLAIEDCVEEVHHPKVDDYESYIYLAVHGVRGGSERGQVRTRELDVVLGERFLITHRNDPSRSVDGAWKQCIGEPGFLAQGPSTVLQAVLSRQADHYVDEVEKLQREIVDVEERLFRQRTRSFGERLFDIKADIARMRGILVSQRETLNRIAQGEFKVVNPALTKHYADVYDEVYRASEILDTLRDISMALLDAHLNIVSHRTNEIMKMLTIMATFMLPLTLITGWFGMNFKNQVALSWRYGEFVALGLFLMITALMGFLLKRKGWL